MKIAILTLPLVDNYGGVLQAYALRTYLVSLGHEVLHIEKRGTDSLIHHSNLKFTVWWYSKGLIARIFNGRIKSQHAEIRSLRQSTKDIRQFVKENIPRIILNEWGKAKEKGFDCIIVGSDQIWRPVYYKDIKDAFLNFAEGWNIKRISYAPSFGVDTWEFDEHNEKICKELLKKFDAVSVREDSGVELCENKFDVNAKHVIDPTLLLEVNDYKEIIERKIPKEKNKKNKVLFSYVLDQIDGTEQFINSLSTSLGYDNKQITLSDLKNKPSIESWLYEFLTADFIFTDSFHGCVFAILFSKPFIVLGNKKRGLSRFESVLKQFNLENRLVVKVEDAIEVYKDSIDWNEVKELLSYQRLEALKYLKKSLN